MTNKQITISTHAKERFKERYPGLELPTVDVLLENAIKQTSINRKGHIVKNENRGIYRKEYKNTIIEYVMSEHKSGEFVICTFNNPPQNITDICYSFRKETNDR